MYILKFENDMGYDGGVTTEILAASKDKDLLERLIQNINAEFDSYSEEVHSKTFAIYSKYNFVSGHVPQHIQVECTEMNKDLSNKYPLLLEFDQILFYFQHRVGSNEFIIEDLKLLD